MKIARGAPLHVKLDFGEKQIAVGRLAIDRGTALFEYAPEVLAGELRINPLWPAPVPGLISPRAPRVFDGLHGVFADSLPDAWGEVLLRRRAEAAKIPYHSLNVLDKLSCIGTRGMGALTYHPQVEQEPGLDAIDLDELAQDAIAVFEGVAPHRLSELIRLGGSSGGARPKILVGMNDAGGIIPNAEAMPDGYSPWIIKFRRGADIEDIGPLEAAYADMAHAAGVQMNETRFLESRRGPGYFATRRFDRFGDRGRLHMASVAGLLDAEWQLPSISYDELFKVVRAVTHDHRCVEDMFSRMVFNVIAHNRDDHAKQHAFLMDESGTWRLAPAYDLTFSRGPGGEHYLAVNGKGAGIEPEDLFVLAERHGVHRAHVAEMIERTREAVNRFEDFAQTYGVSRSTRETAAAQLRDNVNAFGLSHGLGAAKTRSRRP